MTTTIEKPLNSTDRRAIAKIVDERFGLLKRQLNEQAKTVEQEARAAVLAESATAINEARKKVDRLRKKAEKFEAEGRAIEEEARAAGLVLTGYKPSVVSFEIDGAFQPAGLNDKVREKTAHIADARRKASLQIDQLRNELNTEIIVEGIKSSAARSFLDRIPTVEQIAAGAVKELKR